MDGVTLAQLSGNLRYRYASFMSKTHLGLAGLCDEEWVKPSVITATILLEHPQGGRTIVCCSKNQSVADAADAIDSTARTEVRHFNDRAQDRTAHKPYFTIVRPKRPSVKAEKVIIMLKNGGKDQECWQNSKNVAEKWSSYLSATEWFLKVVNYVGEHESCVWDLDENDRLALFEIRRHFQSLHLARDQLANRERDFRQELMSML